MIEHNIRVEHDAHLCILLRQIVRVVIFPIVFWLRETCRCQNATKPLEGRRWPFRKKDFEVIDSGEGRVHRWTFLNLHTDGAHERVKEDEFLIQ